MLQELFASQGLTYFHCDDPSLSLHRACKIHITREQAWLDRQINEVHTRQSRVLIGFFESWETQAYAIETRDGLAAIGLSCFFAIQLATFALNALAHRDFLPEVGDVNLEQPIAELRQTDLMQRKPRCPERLLVAQTIVGIAFRFLTAHELTHILNGHLRLGLHNSLAFNMAESVYSISEAEALEKQTLEMDADCGAVLLSLNTVMMPDEAEANFENAGWPELYRNRALITELWSIAVYTIFRNMDGGGIDLRYASHPPAVRRSLMAFGTFLALQERDRKHKPNEDLLGAMGRAQVAVEKMRAWMVEQEPDLGPIKQAVEMANYETQLLQTWAKLRPQLEPLNRGKGNLAPIQSFS